MAKSEDLVYWRKHLEQMSPEWKAGWEACRDTVIRFLAHEQNSKPREVLNLKLLEFYEQQIKDNALEEFFDDVLFDKKYDSQQK